METKVIIGFITPNRYFAPWEFVESALRIPREYTFIVRKGALIEENRNWIIQDSKDADILLMIDTDMVFTRQDVENILQHIKDGKDYVCGFYRKGHKPYDSQIYIGYDKGLRKHISGELDNMKEIYASGACFVALSKKLIQALPPRPFERIVKNNILLGEDLSFCQRVRDAGFTLWCDPSIKIGHVVSEVV